MSRVVNHDLVKAALVLSAVDPSAGGACVYGRRGTCKTVLARATHALLPDHDVVPGSYANADPDAGPREWETGLLERLADEAKRLLAKGSSTSLEPPDSAAASASNVEPSSKKQNLRLARRLDTLAPSRFRATRAPPFVTVPLSATEDALVGAVDVEASAKSGAPRFQPGCLARAHRGVLYLDELNLMDDAILNLVLTALADGRCIVEREGVQAAHPCRPLALATFNPDEGDVRAHALDRFGAVVSVDEDTVQGGGALTLAQRVEATGAAFAWQEDWRLVARECAEAEGDLRLRVARARKAVADGSVSISADAVGALADAATARGCVGHRAELFAAKLARASAAFRGDAEVGAGDLRLAVALAIAPRATRTPTPEEGDEEEDALERRENPPPPPKPNPEEEESKEEDDSEEEDSEEEDSSTPPPSALPDLVLSPESFPDQDAFLARALEAALRRATRTAPRAGRAKRRATFSLDRGRYVKAVFPAGGVVRKIAVDATLRAAAPRQKARRLRRGLPFPPPPPSISSESESESPPATRRVFISKEDLRNKKMSRRAGTLTVFLVDASGSMAARNRMAAAKAAALALVDASRVRRDGVALVSARGDEAEVLLPPSRSLDLARKRLAELPCGGPTPLAHGLVVAARVCVNAAKKSRARPSGGVSGGGGAAAAEGGAPRVVCLTDGGANVGLERSLQDPSRRVPADEYVPSKAALRAEAIATAARVGRAGVALLVVDTESRFAAGRDAEAEEEGSAEGGGSLARSIARAAGGTYFRMPIGPDPRVASERLGEAIGRAAGRRER